MLRRTGSIARRALRGHRPPRRRQRRAVRRAEPRRPRRRRPGRRRRQPRRLAAELGLDPSDRLVLMQPGARRAVAVVDGPRTRRRPPPEADALVTTEPRPRPRRAGRRLRAVLLAARRSDVVAVAHAGPPRGRGRGRAGHRGRDAASSAPGRAGSSPWSARRSAAAATRCRRELAGRGRRGRAGGRGRPRATGTPASTCAPAWSPSCSRPASRRSRPTPGAPPRPRPLLLPPRRRHRPVRRAGRG